MLSPIGPRQSGVHRQRIPAAGRPEGATREKGRAGVSLRQGQTVMLMKSMAGAV